MTTSLDADAWTGVWSPRRPLATDDLAAGVYRMSRDAALTRRYLEHSPRALISMLVVDVDHDNTLIRALERPMTHPMPSWIAESPSGRGHVGWVLKTPVCRTDAGRPKPLALAARIEEGLRRSLDGDVGYAGLLTKNPTHESWTTTWGTEHAYELGELARGLGRLIPRTLPRRTRAVGLGRNVALFDDLRHWAYRACREYATQLEWEEVVHAYAVNLNVNIPVPLPANEAAQTARSVARWTWRRGFNRDGFRAEQARRGARNTSEQQAAKSRKRLGPGQATEEQALAYVEAKRKEGSEMAAKYPERRPAKSKEMAADLGWNTRRVQRYMAEPRDDFLARAKARRDRAVELRGQGLTYLEIAAEMECSTGTVGRLLHDAKKHAEREAAEAQQQQQAS